MSRIGVVAALAAEAAALADASGVRCCGVGAAPARAAARALAADGARGLVSWGCAAGLAPGLASGTVVVPEAVVGVDGRRFATDAAWRDALVGRLSARVAIRGGTIVEAAAPVAATADKAALRRVSGADAVDMESAAIAAVAHETGRSLLVVRAIADPADAVVPASALAGAGPRGEPRPGRLLAALAARPHELPALLRLRRDFRRAMRALAAVADAAGPDLAWP